MVLDSLAHERDPLNELEGDIKAAVDKGKKKLDRAQRKVLGGLNKHLLGKPSSADNSSHSEPQLDDIDNSDNGRVTFEEASSANTAGESNAAELQVQDVLKDRPEEIKGTGTAAISEDAEQPQRPKVVRNEAQLQTPLNNPQRANFSNPSSSSVKSDDFVVNSSLSTEMILAIYTVIISAYHAWARKSDILANQIPLSVVIPFVLAAFLLGYSMDSFLDLILTDDEQLTGQSGGIESGLSKEGTSITLRQKGGLIRRHNTAPADVNTTRQVSFADDNYESNGVSALTKQLLRRGRSKLTRVVTKTSSKLSTRDFSSHRNHRRPSSFFSGLSRDTPGGIKEFEVKLMAPFTEGPLMDHLLKYKDFSRHRSKKKLRDENTANGIIADATDETDKVDSMRISEMTNEEEEAEHVITDIAIGNAEMNNTEAESFEANEKWSHIVDPMCEFRGMDLFMTDDPDEQIWRQPWLNECGLRDVPTMVSNMMMPMGNLTSYFKLPDWFDDWDNIPEEKEDDPCEVKALKRFLLGDNDYRNARAKLIPYIVNGPLAIRLIKPPPIEVLIYGPRHPSTWINVPKSIDPATGRKQCPLIEVGIDLVSNKDMRRAINIIRPHLPSITIDFAFVISQPRDSEVEEPSACLGLWRVDKVDFERCAVLPEKTIDEAASELKLIMSKMEDESIPLEVAAG